MFPDTSYLCDLPEKVAADVGLSGIRDGYLQKEGKVPGLGLVGTGGAFIAAPLLEAGARSSDAREYERNTMTEQNWKDFYEGRPVRLSGEGYSERVSGIGSTASRHAGNLAMGGYLLQSPIGKLGKLALTNPLVGKALAIASTGSLIADVGSGIGTQGWKRGLATDNNRVTNRLSRSVQGMYSNPNLRANVTGHTDAKDVKGGGGAMHMASPEAEQIRSQNLLRRKLDQDRKESEHFQEAVTDAIVDLQNRGAHGGGPAVPFAGSDIIARIREWLRERMKPV